MERRKERPMPLFFASTRLLTPSKRGIVQIKKQVRPYPIFAYDYLPEHYKKSTAIHAQLNYVRFGLKKVKNKS